MNTAPPPPPTTWISIACRAVAALEFAAGGAENDVVLGGEARQNRGHQTGIGLVGNFGIGAELVASQRADAGLRQQLEAEPLRAEPRHLIETAPRMTRNRDQRHDNKLIIARGAAMGRKTISMPLHARAANVGKSADAAGRSAFATSGGRRVTADPCR